MEQLSNQEQPERPRIAEKNLGACLALKGTVYRDVYDHCSFSCLYPERMELPEPTLVSGNVMDGLGRRRR